MNHLTSNQITEWLALERTPEAAQHLEQCAECRTRVAQAEGPLGLFREALQNAGEQAPPVWNLQAFGARRPWAFPLQSIVVALGVVVLLLVPAYKVQQDQKKLDLQALQAQAALQDRALLAAVERELGEVEPHSMQPLTKLVSYNTSEGRSK